MRIRPRGGPRPAPTDLTGTVRVAWPGGARAAESGPGQVLVVDLDDLDYATAEMIADAGVSAVVNLGRLRGGRYANLGPATLAGAGLVWIDDVGADAADLLVDGTPVRLHRGEVHLLMSGATSTGSRGSVAAGRELDLAQFARTDPRPTPDAQEDRTPSSRRGSPPEPARGARRPAPEPTAPEPATPEPATPEPATPEPATPEPATPEPTTPEPATPEPVEPAADGLALRTPIEGHPVVIITTATATHQDLRALRRFLRTPEVVFVAVGEASVEDLVGLGCAPDLVVRDADGPDDVPSPDLLAMASDVVLVVKPEEPDASDEPDGPDAEVTAAGPESDRPPATGFHRIESAGTAAAASLRLIEQRRPSVIVGAGLAPEETRSTTVPFLDVNAVAGMSGSRRGSSALAMVLTLVVGAALGAGAAVYSRSPDRSESPSSSSELATAARQAQAEERSAQSLVSGVAPRVYGSGLADHGIVVVGLPGTSASEVSAVADQVRAAGGAASRAVTLQRALIDPDGADDVDTVSAGLAAQLADSRVDPTASPYVRMGQLLALAMTTTDPVSAVADPTAVTIRETLQNSAMARFPTDVRLAPTVLLVLPRDASAGRAGAALLADLVDGLATTAAAVVVAGDTASAQPGGTLAALRARTLSDRVSTVDGIEEPTGQVSTVLTLEAALAGVTGAYGALGADGPVPDTGS